MNSENEARISIEISQYGAYYSTEQNCSNCGKRNRAYIPRGQKIAGQYIDCERCGCRIDLTPTPMAEMGGDW